MNIKILYITNEATKFNCRDISWYVNHSKTKLWNYTFHEWYLHKEEDGWPKMGL
jgi:hypothetical protein